MATKKQKVDPKRWTQHVMETSNALDSDFFQLCRTNTIRLMSSTI